MSLLDAHIPQLVASESAFGAKAALMRSTIAMILLAFVAPADVADLEVSNSGRRILPLEGPKES